MMAGIFRPGLLVLFAIVAGLSLTVMDQFSASPQALAQDEDRENVEKLRNERKQLEARLDEIRAQLQQAKKDGDEARIKQLRQETERILKRADAIAELLPRREVREGEERGEAEERRELERHRFHMEIERLELELQAMRLEIARRRTEIASSEMATAAYALSRLQETMEPEQAISYLEELAKESKDPGIQRLIRMQLAHLYRHFDRPEEARKQLRRLILNK
jgi:hypothetical protein